VGSDKRRRFTTEHLARHTSTVLSAGSRQPNSNNGTRGGIARSGKQSAVSKSIDKSLIYLACGPEFAQENNELPGSSTEHTEGEIRKKCGVGEGGREVRSENREVRSTESWKSPVPLVEMLRATSSLSSARGHGVAWPAVASEEIHPCPPSQIDEGSLPFSRRYAGFVVSSGTVEVCCWVWWGLYTSPLRKPPVFDECRNAEEDPGPRQPSVCARGACTFYIGIATWSRWRKNSMSMESFPYSVPMKPFQPKKRLRHTNPNRAWKNASLNTRASSSLHHFSSRR